MDEKRVPVLTAGPNTGIRKTSSLHGTAVMVHTRRILTCFIEMTSKMSTLLLKNNYLLKAFKGIQLTRVMVYYEPKNKRLTEILVGDPYPFILESF